MERLLRAFQGVLWDLACFTHLSALILQVLLFTFPWWILIPAVLSQTTSAQDQRIENLERFQRRHEDKIDQIVDDVQQLRLDMAVVKQDVSTLSNSLDKQDHLSRYVVQVLIGLGVLSLGGKELLHRRHVKNGK